MSNNRSFPRREAQHKQPRVNTQFLAKGPMLVRRCRGRAGPGLHCTALHCTALHCTALHCTRGRAGPGLLFAASRQAPSCRFSEPAGAARQCSAVQCSAVQCSAVQCSAVQCSAVQCSAVQYSAVQCSSCVRAWSSRYARGTSAAVHCAVQCSVMYCAVQCNALCSAVQCNALHCNVVE
jgi:hypothetical protein